MTVAIAVDAVFNDVRGQHLHHANFTSPGAGGLGRRKLVARKQLERRKYLWAEQRGAATVMRECHQ